MTKNSSKLVHDILTGAVVVACCFLLLQLASSAADWHITAANACPSNCSSQSKSAFQATKHTLIAFENSAAQEARSSAPSTSSSPSTPSTDGSSASTKQGAPLQAGVQMIELNLQMLRDVGLDLKNILKATSSLYDEVTIQPVTVMTEPEVVGRGTVINIPIGFMPTGAGPQPKKQRVEMAMNQMRPIIQIMKQDMDEFEEGRKRLDISDDERKDLQPDFDKWRDLVNEVSSKLGRLETLTKAPPYDNSGVASATADIHNDTQKMDEVRRKIYKFLQKEGKKKKSA